MAAAKVPLIEAASKGELGQLQALLAKDLGSVDTTHNGQVCAVGYMWLQNAGLHCCPARGNRSLALGILGLGSRAYFHIDSRRGLSPHI